MEREAPVANLVNGQQGYQDGHARERGREKERGRGRGRESGFHAVEEAGIAGIARMPTSAGKETVTLGAIAVELPANPVDKPSTSSWLNPNPKPLNPKPLNPKSQP